jgi:urease accessory protein
LCGASLGSFAIKPPAPPSSTPNASTSMTTPKPEQQAALRAEIAALEQKLNDAKQQLVTQEGVAPLNGIPASLADTLAANSLHTLLLLSDSALPLGSFAFSSGLESYLAHQKVKAATAPKTGTAAANPSQLASFRTFLHLSLQSLGSTALPYVLAAYREPHRIAELDNDFDASTICTVARRASVAQGRALLSVWERSFKEHHSTSHGGDGFGNGVTNIEEAITSLRHFSTSLRSSDDAFAANAHLAPLWGILTLVLSIPLHSSAYLFMFSHARTVISAAVRASVLGPYQAQHVLASTELRDKIEEFVQMHWERKTEDAGQTVPAIDLWVGRHEMLYSRIFNS